MASVDVSANRLGIDRAERTPTGVSAAIIRDDAALTDLVPAWRQLLTVDPHATVFHSPEWLVTWWKHHNASRSLFVVVLRRGDELVALAPLCLRWTGGPLRLRHLELLGTARTDVGGTLTHPRAPWAGTALWAVLAAHQEEWDLIDLWNIPTHDPLIAAPSGQPGQGLQLSVDPDSVLPVLPVTEWQDHISDDILRNTRRRRRQVEQLGTVTLERCQSSDDLAAALDRLRTLHDKRWAVAGQVSTMRLGAYRAWQEEVAHALFDRGWLYLSTLRCGDRPIAVGLYTLFRRRLVSYVYAFDPDLARYSPANLLVWEVLHDLAHNDLASVYDFGEGAEEYKARWTDRNEPLFRVSVARRTPRSRLLQFLRLEAKPWLWRHATLHRAVQTAIRRRNERREHVGALNAERRTVNGQTE